MKKSISILVVLCCLIITRTVSVFADTGGAKNQLTTAQCQSVVWELFTSLLARDWEMLQPAAFRIRQDASHRGTLIVEAKALPYAYLIGCTPALCSHPRRFITPAAQRLFQRMPYEHVVDVRCPDKNSARSALSSFRMHTTLIFSELSRYLMLHKQTEQTKDFFLQFHALFKKRWIATQQELVQGAETLLWDADAFEQFTDHHYVSLRITVYFYGVVWDGDGTTYDDTKHLLERELRSPPVEFSVTLDVSSGRDRKEAERELNDRAEEATQHMLNVAKSIFIHGPVKKL